MLFAAAGAALVTPSALAAAAALAGRLPLLRNEMILVLTFGALSLIYGALYALARCCSGAGCDDN